jgi:hypothetical protein
LLLPGPLTLAVVLSPAPGYELPKNLAAAFFLAVFIVSVLMRLDGLHTASLSGLAVLLGLASTQIGIVFSFAVVTSLLFMFDVVSIVKSLFGLTYPRMDLGGNDTASAYLRIVRRQTGLSLAVCFAAFLISLAILITPIPQLTFANPVSGSGLLALATLLLILLAVSGVGLPRRVLRGSRKSIQA